MRDRQQSEIDFHHLSRQRVECQRIALKMVMIEVIANDRLGKKVRIKCDSEDTVGDLKVPLLSVVWAPHLLIIR